jgi:nucleoside-diphosphate-sugar epimerase
MEERNDSNGVRVCVAGGAGFIGLWLVKKLLERGYTVHATLRDISTRYLRRSILCVEMEMPSAGFCFQQ